MKPFRALIIALGLFTATSCATFSPASTSTNRSTPARNTALAEIPAAIREAPSGDLQLGEILDDVQSHTGQSVRWGGRIVALTNEGPWTRIEVMAYGLNDGGQPQTNGSSAGRFIAQANIPFDQNIYGEGREITVAGVIAGITNSTSEKRAVNLPLLDTKEYYMWGQAERLTTDSGDWRTAPHRFSSRSRSGCAPDHCRYYPRYCYNYGRPFFDGFFPRYRYRYYRPHRYGYYPRYHFGFGFGFGHH